MSNYFRILFFVLTCYVWMAFHFVSDAQTPANDDDDPVIGKFLIINSFDAMSMDARKNKKELFFQLADSLKKILLERLAPTYKDNVVVYPNTVPAIDSSITSLMLEQEASTAIVIKNINIYFEKTGVEVTGEKGSKDRKVFYDICSVIAYALYNTEEKIKESTIDFCEAYTERSAVSGLLAVGPDIVGKKKDAFKMLSKNADKLFLSPGMPLFSANVNTQRKMKIKTADTLLKYSLSFAHQSQLLHDGLRLRTYINQSFTESGDVSYYNGKYFNAKMRYLHAQGELPGWESAADLGFARLINADTNERNVTYVKVYTRLITSAGMLFQTRGKFVMAEKLISRGMSMRKQWLGENSREYMNSLHNMAVLKKDMGMYDEAERILNRIIPTFRQLFGDSSLQYVGILNNKAMLLAELGRTKEAIELLDEALKIGAVVLSPDYFDYERILINKAVLEQEAGDLDKAESDYIHGISAMEKKGFDDHPDYNNMLLYFGALKVARNDADAISFLSKAKDKIRRRYGNDHPLMAQVLKNEAEYFLNQNSYEEARTIYQQVVKIQLKALGERHKDYLNSLVKLAVCEWQLRDPEKAASNFNKAINGYLFLVNTLFSSMSESEKTNFWRILKPDIDTYFAFVAATWQSKPSLLKEAYNVQLKTKGILINSTRRTKDFILISSDSSTKGLYNEWLNLKSDLAAYYSSPTDDAKDDKVDLKDLEQRANEIEKELSLRSSKFNTAYKPVDISFDDVKGKLGKNELALEIIRVAHHYGEKQGKAEYIGLVVNKDSLNPVLVFIGNSDDLEKNLIQYRNAIKDKKPDPASYNTYWLPFNSIARGNKKIYISVDGVYNSINLNTLRRSDGSFIIDHFDLVLVPNTRSIVTSSSKTEVPPNSADALLLGVPDYGNDEVIPPLPATKDEVEQIDALLVNDHIKTKVLIEQNASEENIKSTTHPAILHVATHGFFLPDVDLKKSMIMGVQVSQAKNNALLRSGLLFNGAASVFTNEPILDASNNGILYAYEAMNLDLQGTDLVVLSACETGLGEIMNGEGVYGLSRSFQVAGANKILMSLWKVDDKPTKELMVLFYKNWIRLKDIEQAFIEAERSIKAKYKDPYFWGAFVLLN